MAEKVEIFNQIYGIAYIAVYIIAYMAIAIFTMVYWKDIYKAACGGNGIPQPNELVKLFCVYFFAIYSNEVIHDRVVFNLNFALTLLGGIGIANLGRFKMDSFKELINKDSKKEDSKEWKG